MSTSKQLIEKNRLQLQEEKTRLEKLLGRIATPKAEGKDEFEAKYPEFGDKEDENAAEVTAYAVNVAEERDLEAKLKRVDAALERITRGTYGICQIGGEPLPPERLAVIPEAESCVEHER